MSRSKSEARRKRREFCYACSVGTDLHACQREDYKKLEAKLIMARGEKCELRAFLRHLLKDKSLHWLHAAIREKLKERWR